MFYKKAWLFLLFLFIISSAAAADTYISFSINIGKEDQSSSFTLFDSCMAMYFNTDAKIVHEHRKVAVSPGSALTLFYFAGESGGSPNNVWRRKRGRSWGVVAREYGYHPNTFGHHVANAARRKNKKHTWDGFSDREFEAFMTVRFFSDYYGYPEKTVMICYDRGFGFEDILIAFNLSRRINKDPVKILEYRQRGLSWRLIAARHKIKYTLLFEPVKPRIKYHRKIVFRDDHRDERRKNDHDKRPKDRKRR